MKALPLLASTAHAATVSVVLEGVMVALCVGPMRTLLCLVALFGVCYGGMIVAWGDTSCSGLSKSEGFTSGKCCAASTGSVIITCNSAVTASTWVLTEYSAPGCTGTKTVYNGTGKACTVFASVDSIEVDCGNAAGC